MTPCDHGQDNRGLVWRTLMRPLSAADAPSPPAPGQATPQRPENFPHRGPWWAELMKNVSSLPFVTSLLPAYIIPTANISTFGSEF